LFVCAVNTKYLTSYGRQVDGPDSLSFPIGVSVNADGKVVTCDTRGNVVKMFDSGSRVCGAIDRGVGCRFI